MQRDYLPLQPVQTPERSVHMHLRIQGAMNMGDVAIIFRILPESPDVDLAALKEAIKEQLPGVQDMQEDPIGFGLSAIKVAIVVPDSEGATEGAEETLRGIDGVESAEIVSLTLN